MHISSFVNNPERESLHTNKYAAGTVSTQTFAERQAIEKQRRVIRSYRDSLIGRQPISEPRSVAAPKRPLGVTKSPMTRQEMNARGSLVSPPSVGHTFHEPPRRGYNPYS